MRSSPKSKISFFFETPAILTNRTDLKQFLENIIRKEKRKLESINYVFCSDKRILEINNQFLQHDFYTDIISFELSGKSEPLIGEIYISVDRVRDNAKNLGQSFTHELHRVIFHGVLHFCGYKDKTNAQALEMRRQEEHYLSLYLK